MTKERLSILQKNILATLDITLDEWNKKRVASGMEPTPTLPYEILIESVYAVYGDHTSSSYGIFGNRSPKFRAFQTSFTRSLHGLYHKKLVVLYVRQVLTEKDFNKHPNDWDHRTDKRLAISFIEFTDKGKSVLNVYKFANNKPITKEGKL